MIAKERYQHLFELGAKDARLWPRWSADALLQGYGDRASMTDEEIQAFKDGYASVRGNRTETQERALDAAQDQLIVDFKDYDVRPPE